MKEAVTYGVPILAGIAVGAVTYATAGAGTAPALAVAEGVVGGTAAAGAAYAGTQSYEAAQQQQEQVKVAAETEQASAAQRGTAIQRQLAQVLATQQAGLAARGISGSGTPQDLSTAALQGAQQDLQANKFNLFSKLGGYAWQRLQLGQQGQAALVGGYVGAASSGLNTYMAMRQIGSTPNPSGSTARAQPLTTYGGGANGIY